MRIIATIVMLITTNSHAAPYLCTADKASGFYFDKSSWQGTNFSTDNKYLITATELAKFPIQVNIIGEDIPVIMCTKGINSASFLHCDSGGPLDMLQISAGEHFTFNQKSLRFMRIVPRGYINVTPEHNIKDSESGTPFIEIGKCVAIQI